MRSSFRGKWGQTRINSRILPCCCLIQSERKLSVRLPRYFPKGQAQHIIQRGNNRDPIFAGDEDYPFYLECLQDAAQRNGLSIHAYVLMTHHVHLLASPKTQDSIPKACNP